MTTRESEDYLVRDTSQDSQTSDAESSSTPLPFLPHAAGSLNRELVDKKNKYQVRFQVNHENVTDEELAAMSESSTLGTLAMELQKVGKHQEAIDLFTMILDTVELPVGADHRKSTS